MDETRIATNAAQEPVVLDAKSGKECDLIDLAYDPANGTRRNGDLFIIGQSGSIRFKNAFIKQPGL